MRTLACAALALFAITLVPDDANAWKANGRIRYDVLGWKFSKVKVQNGRLDSEKCKIELTLFFKAPSIDLIRFKALVKFKSGASMWTPNFENRAIGKRKYSFTFDTTEQGCWAKKKQRPVSLGVLGCFPEREGADCDPSRR